MNIIRFSLIKPIAIMVCVLAIAFFFYNTVKKINVDIFPEVELPAMYVAIPYGGLSPAYMDGFMANEFQKVLLFVSGVKNIDFKSVQGLTLMKLTFYPGTDMAQAAGEVSTTVSRRSEENTSEIQSIMRISYAVICMKKKTNQHKQ